MITLTRQMFALPQSNYRIRLFYGVQYSTVYVQADSIKDAAASALKDNPRAIAAYDAMTGKIVE